MSMPASMTQQSSLLTADGQVILRTADYVAEMIHLKSHLLTVGAEV